MKLYISALLPFLILILSACGEVPMPSMPPWKKADEPEVKPVKMTDVLYCFKCHSAERYEGRAGGYPHIKHRKEFGIDLHCNQCHEVKGHQKMKVIQKTSAPCSNCH